jgi:hypothetical protein
MTDKNKPNDNASEIFSDEEKARETRNEASEALRPFGDKLKSHFDQLMNSKRWLNESGEEVGVVDIKGHELQKDIRDAMGKIGNLIENPNIEKCPEDVENVLSECSLLIDPEIIASAKAVNDQAQLLLKVVKEKMADLSDNSDYIFNCHFGEEFRNDVYQALLAMEKGFDIQAEIMTHNTWAKESSIDFEIISRDKGLERQKQIANEEKGTPLEGTGGTEFRSIHRFNDELRSELVSRARRIQEEITEMARRGAEKEEIAKRMTILICSQLNIISNGMARQLLMPYKMGEFDLGQTDAETLLINLNSFLNAMLAERDIEKTKQVIPALR